MLDGMLPAPHYQTQPRSLSRLSRLDTHRVGDTTNCQLCGWFSHSESKSFSVLYLKISLLSLLVKVVLNAPSGAEYLPMTPGFDNPGQVAKIIWFILVTD